MGLAMTMQQTEYLESRIEAATPMELVCLLYEGALGSVREARRHLAADDAMARSRSITKAYNFIAELIASLDHENGEPISGNLRDLYAYVQTRLLRAHQERSDKLLAEVESLMQTLADGWSGAKAKLAAQPEPGNHLEEPVMAGYGYGDSLVGAGRSWDV
jgi:flagellar protein FliS